MFYAVIILAAVSAVLSIAVSVQASELKWTKRVASIYAESAGKNGEALDKAIERNAELAKALGDLGNLIGSLKGGAVDAVLEAIRSAERIMGGSDIVPMDGKKGE